MKDSEEIIQNLNGQIKCNIDSAGDDNELLQIININNIHLELLVEFMEYVKNLDISKNYEVFMTRNWIHFTHKGEKVFVLSWTDRLEHEERMKLVDDIKNKKISINDMKYYLIIWGMNEIFWNIAQASKMEKRNDNIVVANNSQIIELMNQYIEYINIK
jgi:hypothetical protein